MTMDFEEVKAFMKKANGNGETLYDHLTQLLLKINRDKPDNILKLLEDLSVEVKRSTLKPPLYKELPAIPVDPKAKVERLAAVKATLALFDAIPNITENDKAAVEASLRALGAAGEDEEDGGKAAANALLPSVMKGPHVPNVMGSSNMLESAGVSLGREEMYTIMLSMRRLSTSRPGFLSLRFFGKMYGTQKDYYVVEAKLMPPPSKEKDDPVTKKEPRSFGGSLNEFVYYVANELEGVWLELPDVTPEQIITARSMRRFFTGDINAPVLGAPRFPHPEGSYLRAQIARIAAATVISPKGFFAMEEAEGEEEDMPEVMKEDPEFEPPGAEELASPDGWCHHRAHILKMGRCKKWEPPEAEEGEEEEPPAEEEEEEEEEEAIAILGGLDADETKIGPAWRFKAVGGALHAVITVISMQWPGAVSVAKGKAFSNIYVGWGQKFLAGVYTPPPLAVVATEYTSGFNAEEAEEDDTDPTIEQMDPPPPKEVDGEEEGDEGDNDDE